MKYTIDYGCGLATLYTPHEPESRFYTLAGTCFGIRKNIMGFEIIRAEDTTCSDYERLEFHGDAYVWREDGARKAVAPEWFADEDFDTYYCEECRYVSTIKEAENERL